MSDFHVIAKVNVPRHRTATIPFSIKRLSQQLLDDLSGTSSSYKCSARCNAQLFITNILDNKLHGQCEAIFIGGSTIKGSSDALSDTDLTLVIKKDNLSNFIDLFGAENRFQKDFDFPAGNRIDLRVMTLEDVRERIRTFNCFDDYSFANQDVLYNLQAGYYLKHCQALEKLLSEINYSITHAKKIFNDQNAYIKNYNLKKYLLRCDWFTFYEVLGILYAATCHILYAINGTLFRGYKNIETYHRELKVFPVDLFGFFRLCYHSPNSDSVDNLYEELLPFISTIGAALGEKE
ncbi:hypothetical protein C4J98_2748 [Pseudomonas orientalis]|uniref:hypothetical protein n=1 Tax=Pseudomonas orientalis TaxID=76758 RepID=UPI000F56D5D7|nr:hypothetical protein [Pseudomonas orientalis]AZE84159.1 hypothetical protein C4J98_2748 [Pseudomonas orientalis]